VINNQEEETLQFCILTSAIPSEMLCPFNTRVSIHDDDISFHSRAANKLKLRRLTLSR
jgi:hypothetical protein